MRTNVVLAIAGIAAAGAVLAACSGGGGSTATAAGTGGTASTGSTATAGNSTGNSPDGSTGNGRGGRPGFRGPAASGLIAARTGNVLQVQSSDAQTGVTFTGTTTFSDQITVPKSAVKVGSCVTATASSAASGSSITATTVRIMPAQQGSCTGFGPGGGRFGGGQRPSGAPSGFPSGRPSGFPSNFPSGSPSGFPSGAPSGGRRAGRFGGFAAGKVTAVSGAAITISPSGFGSSVNTIKLTGKTTLSETVKATSKAATVGKCAVVQGKADSTGAVSATSIAITDKVDGSCQTFAFGGRPGGGRGGSGAGSGNAGH